MPRHPLSWQVFQAERVERQAALDGLVLRIGSGEESREKDAAQQQIDRKQLELMFKTEMLSSYSDMEEHIEEEVCPTRSHKLCPPLSTCSPVDNIVRLTLCGATDSVISRAPRIG